MGSLRARDESAPAPSQPILQLRAGYAESPGWFLIQAAEFAPEPLTVANLRVRDVYASEMLVRSLLEIMAGEKWFDHVGDTYRLRPEGEATLRTIQTNRLRWLAVLELPKEPSTRLHRHFAALIESSLQSPMPPGTWCLEHSRHRAPANATIAADLFQFVADFNAFRDDCHMAAWKPLGLEGYEWEAFTLVAGDTATTAEALFDHLAHRGYGTAEYAYALRGLQARGWLAQADNAYALTENGRRILENVENRTDKYFYAAWDTLNAVEVAAIHDDIETLVDQLGSIATS